MALIAQAEKNYRRDLGDNLVLRWSTRDDAEEIINLAARVFRNDPTEPANASLGNLMRVQMNGQHPLMTPEDIAVVEDTRKKGHRLVAMTCLWRQQWRYEDITFTIGRPEIVATDPEYRNRGLVRAVFELVHARSVAEGHMVQAITGIPYFYRQFGYEYALDLDAQRDTYTALIPPAPEGVPEPYTLRNATVDDIPLIAQLYDQQCASSIVSTAIDQGWWRHQILHWNEFQADGYWHVLVISNVEGAFCGYVTLPSIRRRNSIPVFDLGVIAGINLAEVILPVMRAILAQNETILVPSNPEPVSKISFMMHRNHPVYDILKMEMVIRRDPPYAWYVRVPDLPTFLRAIAPVLEKRLAQSALAGYSGELALNFYRSGLRMVFAEGRLHAVENWRSPLWHSNENAGFPPLVFLQLLCGYRSLDELRYAYPDVWANDTIVPVLKTLFPARASWAIPLG
ncbi:MAG TPA: GNAT family N-acetyltransferase [Ktedonobacteraceae bacterium]|nr:GNAT family N-acetyltransferase [Ktedonobacteraceae bacterium]